MKGADLHKVFSQPNLHMISVYILVHVNIRYRFTNYIFYALIVHNIKVVINIYVINIFKHFNFLQLFLPIFIIFPIQVCHCLEEYNKDENESLWFQEN